MRLAALGPAPSTDTFTFGSDDGSTGRSPTGTRSAYLAGADVDVPVVTRAAVGLAPTSGPLFVDEYDTTVVVAPGWSVALDPRTRTLVLEHGRAGG